MIVTSVSIKEIMRNKGLNEGLFSQQQSQPFEPVFDSGLDHLAETVRWLYDNIYSKPYIKMANSWGRTNYDSDGADIPRLAHGIQHVCRVALYIPVLANLYVKFSEGEYSLTSRDVALLQLAALFHDSARENEGVDRWDHESAYFFYLYLKHYVSSVTPQEAKISAEAVANKDSGEKYFLIDTDKDEGKFVPNDMTAKKNLYQNIMHDADCLDIIRARSEFSAEYLDFFQAFQKNPEAMQTLAKLIVEVRSLIYRQGDGFYDRNNKIKEQYEQAACHKAIENDITNNAASYPILFTLSHELFSKKELDTLSLAETMKLSTDPLISRFEKGGMVFLRAIGNPTMQRQDYGKNKETAVERELRKIFRDPGLPTNAGYIHKDGNIYRSMSMAGPGSIPYHNVGYVRTLYPEDIALCSWTDISSGYGKKPSFHVNEKTTETIAAEIDDIKRALQFGKEKAQIKKNEAVKNFLHQNEIIAKRIKFYEAVYITDDPRTTNNFETLLELEKEMAWSILILKGIYLQKAYARIYDETKKKFIHQYGEEEGIKKFEASFSSNGILPIVYYSGVHNKMEYLTVDDAKIMQCWLQVLRRDYTDIRGELGGIISFNPQRGISILGISFNDFFELYSNDSIKNRLIEEVQGFILAQKNQIEENLVNEINNTNTPTNKHIKALFLSERIRSLVSEKLKEQIKRQIENFPWEKKLLNWHFLGELLRSDNIDNTNINERILQTSCCPEFFTYFALTKALNLEDVRKNILQKVQKHPEYFMTTIVEPMDLLRYKIFCHFFEIPPKKELNLAEKCIPNSSLPYFSPFSESLGAIYVAIQCGLLNEDEVATFRVFFNQSNSAVLSKLPYHALPLYLSLIELFGLNAEETCNKYFQNDSFHLTCEVSYDFFEPLDESKILQNYLHQETSRLCHIVPKVSFHSPNAWFNVMHKLCSQRKLTQEALDIIRNSWEKHRPIWKKNQKVQEDDERSFTRFIQNHTPENTEGLEKRGFFAHSLQRPIRLHNVHSMNPEKISDFKV